MYLMALEHKDSMGTGSVIKYGHVQRMSAGSGVVHSEFNHSQSDPVHFLQIWIAPNVRNIAPSYEEKYFDPASKQGQWRLIASPDGEHGSVSIHQDAYMYASILDGDDALEHAIAEGRSAYVHVIRGAINVNGIALHAGDALKLVDEPKVTVSGALNAEILMFDLPTQH